ncbi:MAG: hypothetical protein RSB04_12855 [Gordonibacter sp.]|uniref:hypothetical protein n=1 Tax=Gordonibacter sp. TaxID=1968902 RepID=UPI002FC64CFD
MARREAGCYLTQAEMDAVCPRLTGFEWKVYTALATMRGASTGKTVPVGCALVMAKTGLGRSQVYEAVKSLCEYGFMAKESRRGGNVYAFPMASAKSGIPDC